MGPVFVSGRRLPLDLVHVFENASLERVEQLLELDRIQSAQLSSAQLSSLSLGSNSSEQLGGKSSIELIMLEPLGNI